MAMKNLDKTQTTSNLISNRVQCQEVELSHINLDSFRCSLRVWYSCFSWPNLCKQCNPFYRWWKLQML